MKINTPHSFFIKQTIIFLLMVFFVHGIEAQIDHLGIPPIRNFTKKAYSAAPQNWDIIQAENQVMYFANNLGLLSFDGNYWQVKPIGNHTIVRSLCKMNESSIAAGGQGDIGIFKYDRNGVLSYTSLVDKMPEKYRQFEDVWNIVNIQDTLFFNTTRDVFVWDGQQIKAFPFGSKIDKIVKIDGSIWLYNENDGLHQWQNGNFVRKSAAFDISSPVTGIIPWQGDTLAISTLQDGMFYYTTNTSGVLKFTWNDYFRENWITGTIVLDDGSIAVGTAQNGVFVFNPLTSGYISLTVADGLQNNNILSLFQDETGDLWTTSEHGIDLIQYHSPYRILFPDGDLKGAGYAAALYQNKLYLGTTNGVYKYNPDQVSQKFIKIQGSKGQVWKLDTINNILLLGHHLGAFQIQDDKLIPLYKENGTWRFIPIDDQNLAFGTYEGIGLYNSHEKTKTTILSGFKESSRIIIKDIRGKIWLSHPYRGVFQLEIDPLKNTIVANKMTDKNGLSSDLNNYIYLITGIPYVCTDSGIYQYNSELNRFIRDTMLEAQIGKKSRVQLLYEDSRGNIWYHTVEGGGVLETTDQGLKKLVNKKSLPPMPEKLLGGFEFMLELTENQYLFGCDQGFVVLNKNALQQEKKYQTLIHAVSLAGLQEAILFRGYFPGNAGLEPYELEDHQNAIRFNYSCTSFGEEIKEYRYQLEGLDNGYTDWTTNNEVQYNNLKHGHYTFLVQSRVGGQIQDSVARFQFHIRTPWYKMQLIQFLLLLFLSGVVFSFFIMQRKKFETEKTEIKTLHQEVVDEKIQLVEKTEQEIIQLKNEKLQSEIQHKNNELASATMHLVQKQELLSGIQNELKKVLKHQDMAPEQKQDIKSIIMLLQEDARIDDDWEQFSNYFDEVHGYFLQKLKEKYPQLTPNDHKLCAYLRMNLSSKEIASLLNISLRGVEGARYRLRKKLGLPQDTNLGDFMNHVE